MRAIADARAVVLATLFLLVGLALPLGAFYVVGRAQARRETQASRAAEIGARLEALRANEARRPWYQYQRLYHEPLAIDNGSSLLPSPLATEPRDPIVRTWFAVGADGRATSPTGGDEASIAAAQQ